jgi:hypothetical protein
MATVQQGKKNLSIVHQAKEAVELAQGIESGRNFGGHRHGGGKRRGLLRLPLPQGYRRVKR